MKNHFSRSIIALSALLLFSISAFAQKKKDKNALWIEENTTITFAWEGSYQGTIPCADCDGIQTLIELQKGNTYKMKSKFIGKDAQVFEDEGRFLWKKEGNYFVMVSNANPNDSIFALLSKDRLTLLDKKGKRITGSQAIFYILNKENISLMGKYWKLIELNGKPIPTTPKLNKEPFIRLTAESSSFSGSGGCNTLMGKFEQMGGNKLNFGGIATTMMACENMETEDQFRLALESTDHFVIKGDNLIFQNVLNQGQAKFVLVLIK
ncbi:MAG: copper resistance protein NlpE N-terminal domain-containing protein [Bacteroidia bacterium]|nr:copper resistance protein NlpE N-terminal domain-containing protein [Bacteroidia bacterium]